jgi:riboflavin transporter
MQRDGLQRTVRIGMLGAIAFLLMYFGQIHVPPFAVFLKYDPGDIPAMVATFTLGPAAGVAVQTIKAGLFWFSGKSTAGWVGVLANLLAGWALVLAAWMIHKTLHQRGARAWPWGIVTAAVGAIVMSLVLIPVNWLLIYPVFGMKGDAAWYGALYLSTPFNLFKGFLSSVVSLAFYRRLAPYVLGRAAQRAA